MERSLVLVAICFVPGVALGLMTASETSIVLAFTALFAGYSAARQRFGKPFVDFSLGLMVLGCGMLCAQRYLECGADEIHFQLAQRCCGSLQECISCLPFEKSRNNALLTAFLTGERGGLEPELLETFRKSGASHLLALSGLHLGIIYLMLEKLLSIGGGNPLARKLASVAIIAATGFYTIMTGASPSIVRAFLFILAREVSSMAGRKISLLNCLSFALIIQLSISPASILKASMQLSYLAMLGICLLAPPLQSLFPPGKGPVRWIWNTASLSISCQAFTAPLSWHLFKSFPQYFLVTNLFALPLMTLLMICSVTTVILSATGCCPLIMIKVTELCCDLLVWILETICRM